jgi:hypothetical protein
MRIDFEFVLSRNVVVLANAYAAGDTAPEATRATR